VSTPAAITWPLAGFAAAVGPGGERVADLLDALAGGSEVDVAALAPETPAGRVDLPVVCVDLAAGVEAAAAVDPSWLAEVDRRRTAARDDVVAAGRAEALEAALHVALLVATGSVDGGVDSRIASGARLWLLAGAVASALRGPPDPFDAWARLVAAGWWPVGPSGGRLVVSAAR
jgi:hypothetical protein